MKKPSQEYIEYLNCQAENEKKQKHCWNCGGEVREVRKVKKSVNIELNLSNKSGGFLELDEKGEELLISQFPFVILANIVLLRLWYYSQQYGEEI